MPLFIVLFKRSVSLSIKLNRLIKSEQFTGNVLTIDRKLISNDLTPNMPNEFNAYCQIYTKKEEKNLYLKRMSYMAAFDQFI